MYYTKQVISFDSVQINVIHIRFAFASSRLFTLNTLLSIPTYGGTQYSPIFCNICRDSEVLVEILKYRIYVEFSCTSESHQVFQNSVTNRDRYFRRGSSNTELRQVALLQNSGSISEYSEHCVSPYQP